MKKLIIVYIVLIIALVLLVMFKSGGNLLSFIPSFGSNASAEINGKKISLLVARSEQERQKGLSGRDKLDSNQGMIFVFEKPGKYPFWMINMKFPLDIIYINNEKVVHIFKKVPPQGDTPIGLLPRYTPSENANYVLELNAGKSDELKIKKGTVVKLSGVK